MAKRKAKSKPINKVRDEAARLLQKLVRLKAADSGGMAQCVTCGCRKHWSKMHGGHWIPRGVQCLLLVEENIHPQCPGCNTFHMKHGIAPYQYYRYMVNMYGSAEVLSMLCKAEENPPHKWDRKWLTEFIVNTREQIAEQLVRLRSNT